jgi:cytochrome c6
VSGILAGFTRNNDNQEMEVSMKKFVVAVISLSLFSLCGSGFAGEMAGEALFKNNCALCHPNGGNIIRPEKTLLKKDLDEYGIKTAEDIVHLMRNPGPGMKTFSKDILSDTDAKKIAEYVLKTFQ